MRILLILLFSFFLSFQWVGSASFHVMVKGSPSGNGTVNNPWDLQTALSHPKKVSPGDTIWIHGGIYEGEFLSYLTGSSQAHILVRNVPGERVVIDGVKYRDLHGILQIEGEHTWYMGLTVTNSSPQRIEYLGQVIDTEGITILGENNKVINCVVHNCGGNGVGFWSTALHSEVYGCIIYNNGSIGSSRGHGHGIYSQNNEGIKLIRDNILFNSFSLGIHIYSEGGNIQGYHIEGNMMFNSGLPGNGFLERHILVGGGRPADQITIKSNYLYNRPEEYAKSGIQLGYSNSENLAAECSNNYLGNCSFYVIKGWKAVSFTNNLVYTYTNSSQLVDFDDYENIVNPEYNNNQYFRGEFSSLSFDEWKQITGQDKGSSYSNTLPQKTITFLRKNLYEPGRAHLAVYNFEKLTEVKVDLSDLLETGSDYEVYDVNNLQAGPIATGVYHGGSISVPMDLTEVEKPQGNVPDEGQFVHTAPDFGVFLITGPLGKPVNQSESGSIRILNYYPNPTSDLMSVDFFSSLNKRVTVEVVDSMGRVVNSEYYFAREGKNQYVVNLSGFPAGFYLVNLQEDGSNVSCKVIKKDFALKR